MDGLGKKVPGEVIGASHLVHEYIGPEVRKLRIQFVDPREFLDGYEYIDNRFVICARSGFLEEPMNVSTMCHIVRNTEWGAEMRSIFWLGHVSKRDGNEQVSSIEGLLGNTALARLILLDEQLVRSAHDSRGAGDGLSLKLFTCSIRQRNTISQK